jgi:hypothetical protein
MTRGIDIVYLSPADKYGLEAPSPESVRESHSYMAALVRPLLNNLSDDNLLRRAEDIAKKMDLAHNSLVVCCEKDSVD